jgi:hypothetical protein
MTMVVKTANDPHGLIASMQSEVTAMDGELPVLDIKTLDDYVSESVSTPRFNTTLV